MIFGGPEAAKNRHRLFQGVAELLDRLRMPRTMRAAGVAQDKFLQDLARSAFQDLSNRTNPPIPLVAEYHRSAQTGHYGSDDQVD